MIARLAYERRRPRRKQIEGLTYRFIRANCTARRSARSWDAGNKLMAALILLLVGGMYLYFSFWLD